MVSLIGWVGRLGCLVVEKREERHTRLIFIVLVTGSVVVAELMEVVVVSGRVVSGR